MAAPLQDAIAAARIESDLLKDRIQSRNASLSDTTLRAAAANVPSLRMLALKRRNVLRCPNAKVYAVDWASDGLHLLSASQDGHLILWNAYTGHKVQAVTLRMNWVMSCAYAPSGHLIASGGLDNVCSVYDLRRKQSVVEVPVARELIGHTAYVSACRFRSDREMVTGSGDATCALWDIETESRIRHFTGHLGDVTSVALSPKDPHLFVSGSCDARAFIWDTRTTHPVQMFSGHARDVNAVDYFPDGFAVATGSDDATSRLFDMRANRELANYSHGTDHAGVTSVAFSKSGRVLVSASEDNDAQLWDTLRSERIGVLRGHDARIACVRVSPTGGSVATGGWDAKVMIWGI